MPALKTLRRLSKPELTKLGLPSQTRRYVKSELKRITKRTRLFTRAAFERREKAAQIVREQKPAQFREYYESLPKISQKNLRRVFYPTASESTAKVAREERVKYRRGKIADWAKDLEHTELSPARQIRESRFAFVGSERANRMKKGSDERTKYLAQLFGEVREELWDRLRAELGSPTSEEE